VWQHRHRHRESAPAPFGQGMLGQMGNAILHLPRKRKGCVWRISKTLLGRPQLLPPLVSGHEPTPTQNRTPPFLFSSFPTPFTKLLCWVKRFWLSGWNHVSLLILIFFYAVENLIVKWSLNPGLPNNPLIISLFLI